MNKIIQGDLELKSFTDDFLDQFANCIEQNDRPKWLERAVQRFIRFWNYNYCWSFEVGQPITYVHAHISNPDDIIQAISIFEDDLEVTLWQE